MQNSWSSTNILRFLILKSLPMGLVTDADKATRYRLAETHPPISVGNADAAGSPLPNQIIRDRGGEIGAGSQIMEFIVEAPRWGVSTLSNSDRAKRPEKTETGVEQVSDRRYPRKKTLH